MAIWSNLAGTVTGFIRLGLTGVRLKNDAGTLAVRNADDTADSAVTASKVNVSGDAIDINSDAAATAADWKYTLQRPATGMTADVTLTLPVDDGTADQVLKTDGAGILAWVSATAAAVGIAGENKYTASVNYTIAAGNNASSIGPITINSGVTVTVPSGSRWVIF